MYSHSKPVLFLTFDNAYIVLKEEVENEQLIDNENIHCLIKKIDIIYDELYQKNSNHF